MPPKSITEMTARQRFRHSLGAKTFRTVVIMVLVISVAAIGFGFYLYVDAVKREYRTEACHLANVAASLTDRSEVVEKSRAILEIYDAVPEEERVKGDINYILNFTKEKDILFEKIRYTLHVLERENEAGSVYVGAIDQETNRLIYIIDSDYNLDTFCDPGFWDDNSAGEMKIYMEGARVTLIDRLLGDTEPIPAVVTRTEKYGHLCTAASPLFTTGKYKVMMFADMDMSHVTKVSRIFLVQYILLMLVAALIAAQIITQGLKKTVVKPINDLAETALAYSRGRQNEESDKRYFADLNIRTGDEIENLSLIMRDMEADLNDYVANLTTVTAEKERISTELDVAGQIQEGMIPHIYPAFPDRPEFDIYALMHPAKEVGGDFYDFFLVDEDHLAMVMADVSGKGIPAALFMMASKILIQNYSMIDKRSPAKILELVNEAICSSNSAEMFVTVWLGILEIPTGIVRAANAGHEYPVIRTKDGEFKLFKDPHGLVVGGMSGMVYKEYEFKLESGDCIFQYTDGVTEATNSENELFGTKRMLDALNLAPGAEPEEILENVLSGIYTHVNGADQFDDITMLCMKYFTGSVNVKELNVEAETNNLPKVMTFIEESLEEIQFPMKEQMQLSVAAEEIFVNICHYAYAPKTGNVHIRLVLSKNPTAVSLTFIDSGKPYNPLEKEDPDVTLSAEDRQIGGLGIYMVKQTMDKVSYRYDNGKNMLILKKKLQGKDKA
ncbi:MAG: SpoIIE family protein phosphatase [Eubacterium sp.]|nr:SpoIIE family protein phosphatase [Eubacterium sp.]